MKHAIFSDIHGNYEALKAIISDINRKKIKNIIYLGDAVGLGPSSKECVDLLSKSNVIFILGNHELYVTKGSKIDKDMSNNEVNHNTWVTKTLSEENKLYLNNGVMKYSITINNKKILFVHFLLNDNIYPFYHLSIFKDNSFNKIIKLLDYDYIFFGHKHDGGYYFEENKKCFGVGSSGCVKDDNTFYYILNDDNNEIKIKKEYIKYNKEKFDSILDTVDYPDKEKIKAIFF